MPTFINSTESLSKFVTDNLFNNIFAFAMITVVSVVSDSRVGWYLKVPSFARFSFANITCDKCLGDIGMVMVMVDCIRW